MFAERLAIMDALLEAGTDVNARSRSGRTVLLAIAAGRIWGDPALLKTLIARGADARVRDDSGDTALTLLISSAHPELLHDDERVALLIAAGVDVNATNLRGQTALQLVREMAARSPADDVSDIIRTLIAAGAR